MTDRRKLVMTVEDAPNLRRLIAYNLKQAGYDTLEAESGEAAFRMLGTQSPDLILLDVRMPGWDGFAFLEQLRRLQRAAATPVIMLTAMSASLDIERALRLGAVDYLVKPFDPALMLTKVAAIFRGHLPVTTGPHRGKDRRQFHRGPILNATLDPQPGGTGLDVSEGGIAFTTNRVMRFGEIVLLQCPELFAQIGLESTRLRVRVVRVDVPDKGPRRVGAVFIGLTEHDRAAIRRYALYGERPRDLKVAFIAGRR